MKLDTGFGLDNAAWPAFVVDSSGNVRHANEAAVNTFGAGMGGGPALSGSLWSPEMELRPGQALRTTGGAPPPLLHFKVAGKAGGAAPFQRSMCALHHH